MEILSAENFDQKNFFDNAGQCNMVAKKHFTL